MTGADDLRQRLGSGIDRVDGFLGDRLDEAMMAHHRRRLRNLGQGWVLGRGTKPAHRADPQWWVPGVPVREGNSVEVLVDGRQAVPRITELLRGARKQVHLAAWHVSPDFWMDAEGTLALRDLLAETAERVPVRLLMWAGAPVPVFPPSRAHVRADRDELLRDSRLECLLDRRERPMHCHHEKLVVVDDEVAVVGGLDLTHLQGSRLDGNEHPKVEALGWHDVVAVLRGPVVADVANHFQARWAAVGGEQLPPVAPPEPVGEHAVQLVRTIPEHTYDFLPRGEFTNLAGYLQALRSAEHLVYLENQFLWSTEVVQVLRDKLAHPPSPDFRLVLVLPRKPSSGNDTTSGQLGRLIEADKHGRLLAATLLGPTRQSSGVYVHAKVGIVDDRWLTIGSTNLNEHSLYNDTEVNILTLDRQLARQTRLRLWSEHLQLPVEQLDRPAHEVVDQVWKAQCEQQKAASRAGADPVHRVGYLQGLSRRVDRLRGPLDAMVVDG